MIALAVDLLDLSVKATLLCLAAAVVTALMRGASAASRHAVWTGMFVAVLALPIARVLLPGLPVFVLAPQVLQVSVTGSVSSPTVDAGLATVSTQAPVMPASSFVLLSPPPAPAVVAASVPRTVLSPIDLVVPLWLFGVLLLLLRAAVGGVRVRQLNRSATTVTEAGVLDRVHALRRLFGVRRPIVLRAYPDWMPMTWGVVRPVILAPAAVIDAGADGRELLEPLLVHEVAHIARFDVVSAALARLAVACGWFNPLLWLAARQARLERERACDDAVLTKGAGLKASDYANQLLVLAQIAHPAFTGSSHTLAMARRSQLESRVRSILDARTNRRPPSRASRLVAVMLVIVAVPAAAVRLAARTVALEPIQASAPIQQPAPQVPAPPLAAVPAPTRERAAQRPASAPPAIADAPSPLPAMPQSTAPPPSAATPSQHAPSPNYVIGVGDLLTIIVWRAPELSGDVRVGPDGRITLPKGNPVPAAGWTTDGLKEALTAELKRCCLATPDVIIQVKEIVSLGAHRTFFFFNQDTAYDPARRSLPLATAFAQQPDWNTLWRTLSARELEAEKHVALRIQIGTSAPLELSELKRAREALASLAPWLPQPSDAELFALRSRFGDAIRNLDLVEVRFDNGMVSIKALADAYVAAAEALKEPGCPGLAPAVGWTCANGNWLPPHAPRVEARLDSRSLSDAELTNALKNAAIMSPDTGRADMLLGLAQRYAFTPDMVSLYVAAANGMTSESERARVFAQAIRVKAK